MINKINAYLAALEQEKNIKILLATETGSRAWGFDSMDSDFDIRIIYVHKLSWYLSLSDRKDNITRMLDNNDIDIAGWDLRKSLNLLKKSNAGLMERVHSPIVYTCDSEFLEELKNLSNAFYSKIASIHHYLSMAKKFAFELDRNKPYKLKKFFYALRPSLVCKWIIEKDEVPPIHFSKIYKNLDLQDHIVKRIDDLVELKKDIQESYLHSGELEIYDLIHDSIKMADKERINLNGAKGNPERMNELYIKYIYKYDDQRP